MSLKISYEGNENVLVNYASQARYETELYIVAEEVSW